MTRFEEPANRLDCEIIWAVKQTRLFKWFLPFRYFPPFPTVLSKPWATHSTRIGCFVLLLWHKLFFLFHTFLNVFDQNATVWWIVILIRINNFFRDPCGGTPLFVRASDIGSYQRTGLQWGFIWWPESYMFTGRWRNWSEAASCFRFSKC